MGTLNATGNIITNNEANSNAGIYNEGPLSLTNSTVSSNTATRDSGGITNYDDTAIVSCTIANNRAQGTTNAQLGALADNGGATQTHTLPPASLAYNVIPPTNCAASVDQRGVTRPQSPNCDAGAFELQQLHTLTVTRNGMGSGTVSSNPAGINCGGDCAETYAYDTAVTLTATLLPTGAATRIAPTGK